MIYRASGQRYMKTCLRKKENSKKNSWEICESVGVFRTSPLLSCKGKVPPLFI
jgi:hypothetical protein